MTGPLRFIGSACWLVWRAARGVAIRFWQGDPLVYTATAAAISQSMWRQLPMIAAMSALIGALTGILAGQVLNVYKAELLVLAAMTDALFRHILPLVIGIFASGSTAVDLASRMGAMRLANEIEALESMGNDSAGFVLGPALVGVMIANPPQLAVGAIVSLVTANLTVAATANIGWHDLYTLTLTDRSGLALLAGLGKTTLFSMVAFATGAAIGSRPVRVPADIGARAGEAFRIGLLAILGTATLWVALT
ncbi:MAG: ABC transporter permease [Novosphingobium sp.]|nr:ABC transporter permease [Novosphingobium sp.]